MHPDPGSKFVELKYPDSEIFIRGPTLATGSQLQRQLISID